MPLPKSPGRARLLAWLPRVRNRHLLLVDCCLLLLASWLAFAIRLETLDLGSHALAAVVYALGVPLIDLPIFVALGLYSRCWSYANADDVLLLGSAVLLADLLEGFVLLGILAPLGIVPGLPRSVPLIDTMLSLFFVAGPRFALRVGIRRLQRWSKAGAAPALLQRALVVGAGEAGALVVHELEANPQMGLLVAGFVDDDRNKAGLRIHHYPVLGTRQDIPRLVHELQIDQVIIAMPSASGRTVREILAICGKAGVAVRTVPAMYELLAGRIGLQPIRQVQIEDLLRREPVQTDPAQVAALLRRRRVLVTGGGGSIGSELCRQIAGCEPANLILLGHGENSIFEISNELRLKFPGLQVTPVIADLRDRERLSAVLARQRPEIVFHAAAHKHVPLMEANVEDAVTNNVLGTRQLVDACVAVGVTHFVLISSDKAVNPTSVMGATKRVAELIVQQAAVRTGRCFVAVRFGNVLGSRGSVVPFFQRQIARGGPVTVTHPEMRRYFMTIPEAVQLVLQAATLGRGGEVFVLDMGEPVRIVDLASDLIRLSGLEPGRDIEIAFTGLRPGEKLFEEIFAHREAFARTAHGKIFVCRNGTSPECVPPTLDTALAGLVAAARGGDPDQVRHLLAEVVPEYTPPAPAPSQPLPAAAPGARQSRPPDKPLRDSAPVTS